MVDADVVKEIDEEIVEVKSDLQKLQEDVKILKRDS